MARFEETDSNITWSGDWQTQSNANYSGGATKYTNSSTATMGVNFTGLALNLISDTAAAKPTAVIATIDGVDHVFSQQGSTAYQQTTFAITGLSAGEHSLLLSCPSAGGLYWSVDALEADSLKPYSPISSVTSRRAVI